MRKGTDTVTDPDLWDKIKKQQYGVTLTVCTV